MKNICIFILFSCLVAGGWQQAHAAGTFTRTIRDFTFSYQDQEFPVDGGTLASWQKTVSMPTGNTLIGRPYSAEMLLRQYAGFVVTRQEPEPVVYNYDPAAVFSYIKTVANAVDIRPVEPELTVENGRATTFIPPQDGRIVDTYKTLRDALSALQQNIDHVGVTASTSTPQTKLAATNQLGITKLIGHGVSSFKGSPSNRRHNIQVGVQQMKGIILAPKEEFSFNKFLGPVDGEHNFLPELVIKSNNTVPEFGGGLCQVSSTTFRGAMAAGLPITQRRNHAYPVSYYSPQGTDATIYPGVIDLKFVNNTPGSVLIWPYLQDKDTLVFDFYGTDDGRKVVLEKPVQYDRKPDGSMKATWTRVITASDGQTTTDIFKSTYQSPALFHKEETFPPAASSTPETAAPHVGAPSST